MSKVGMYYNHYLEVVRGNIYEIYLDESLKKLPIERNDDNAEYFTTHDILLQQNRNILEPIKKCYQLRFKTTDEKHTKYFIEIENDLKKKSNELDHLIDYNIKQLYEFEMERLKQKWIVEK